MRLLSSAVGLTFLMLCLFCAGCLGGGLAGGSVAHRNPAAAHYNSLPHHVAKSPDALSFRFAMVHDVVHERFPKHGPAFYQERDRKARAKLATLPPDSDEALALLDDIGTDFERLGKPADAVNVLRDKLGRQTLRGINGRAMYTTYANLGTFLIHANMKAALAGDQAALAQVTEGRELIRQSIAVNPNAHFGREEWQLVAADTFLAFGKQPDLLRKFDLIGDRLESVSAVGIAVPGDGDHFLRPGLSGRPFKKYRWAEHVYFGDRTPRNSEAISAEDRKQLRDLIEEVGREPDGKDEAPVGRRAPFDEPCLGIIGMWRQGGGANPHFALSLGEIMLRVGQRFLAWACYERAARLAGKFWPTPELQDFLRDHCKKQQLVIEQTLAAAEVEKLRPEFDAELARGEGYQAAYQAYEAQKIAVGGDIEDPTFFDEFHAGREPIASRPGPEEWYASRVGVAIPDHSVRNFWAWALLTGGAAVMAFALLIRSIARRRVRVRSV